VFALAKQHELVVGTVLSGLLYGLARFTVAAFCDPLGVSPGDLDLNTQDHLVLAASWLLAIASFLLMGVVIAEVAELSSVPPLNGWHRLRQLAQLIGGLAALALLAFLVWAMFPGFDPLVPVGVAVAPGALLWFCLSQIGWAALRPEVRAGLVGAVVVLVAGLAVASSWLAGVGLRDDGDTSMLPLPLRAVLVPAAGTISAMDTSPSDAEAELNSENPHDTECVVRIAPRVFLSRDHVAVAAETQPFRVSGCEW
jgi:hypothetical protein